MVSQPSLARQLVLDSEADELRTRNAHPFDLQRAYIWLWHSVKESQIGVSLAVTDVPMFSSWMLCTSQVICAQLPWRNAHPFYSSYSSSACLQCFGGKAARRKIWFSCQSLVPHSKHGNKSFCLLPLAAARTLGDNGQLAPKCYTSGNIKQHLVDRHLMHFRSYSLTVGRARKTSNCRTWYAFELGYCRTPHITEALPLALAKRINGLNTPKNSAFHPCQHGCLVILVSPSGVTSGKISTLDWEFQQPMNTAPCVFQFLTDKTWWKNVKGSWDLAGVKPHVFTFLKVWPDQLCHAGSAKCSVCACVLRSPSKCSRNKPSQTNSLG